jgi:hypothetical protein
MRTMRRLTATEQPPKVCLLPALLFVISPHTMSSALPDAETQHPMYLVFPFHGHFACWAHVCLQRQASQSMHLQHMIMGCQAVAALGNCTGVTVKLGFSSHAGPKGRSKERKQSRAAQIAQKVAGALKAVHDSEAAGPSLNSHRVLC